MVSNIDQATNSKNVQTIENYNILLYTKHRITYLDQRSPKTGYSHLDCPIDGFIQTIT